MKYFAIELIDDMAYPRYVGSLPFDNIFYVDCKQREHQGMHRESPYDMQWYYYTYLQIKCDGTLLVVQDVAKMHRVLKSLYPNETLNF